VTTMAEKEVEDTRAREPNPNRISDSRRRGRRKDPSEHQEEVEYAARRSSPENRSPVEQTSHIIPLKVEKDIFSTPAWSGSTTHDHKDSSTSDRISSQIVAAYDTYDSYNETGKEHGNGLTLSSSNGKAQPTETSPLLEHPS